MTKRQFSDEERYAVYTVHNEKCYMCGEPLDLLSMQVDHILPENLIRQPLKLLDVLRSFGLPPGWDLQAFANWMPACGPCNSQKRSRVFEPTPLIQIQLQIAAEKAERAETLASTRVSEQMVSRAWNTIKRAAATGSLTPSVREAIVTFAAFHATKRVPELLAEPMRLTPLLAVLSERDGVRISRGPYGAGGGPIGPNVQSSFYCPTCGNNAWNGAICVACGQMSDE